MKFLHLFAFAPLYFLSAQFLSPLASAEPIACEITCAEPSPHYHRDVIQHAATGDTPAKSHWLPVQDGLEQSCSVVGLLLVKGALSATPIKIESTLFTDDHKETAALKDVCTKTISDLKRYVGLKLCTQDSLSSIQNGPCKKPAPQK